MLVDYIIFIWINPRKIISDMQTTLKIKNDKIETTSNKLGERYQEKEINGIRCWTITSVEYIKSTF